MLLRLSILLAMISCASAATWYAASDGNSTNGSYASPWSVLYAVTNSTGNPHLANGDTVVFKNGSYSCVESNAIYVENRVLNFRRSGAANSKITYMAESLWGFSFDGGLMLSGASNLVVKYFRVFYSDSTNRNKTVSGTFPRGITEDSPGNEFLHNLIENNYGGFNSWSGTRGKYIAGNVCRFGGMYDYVDYSGAARGGGGYLQNIDDSNPAIISGNITYFNVNTGFGASGNQYVWGFQFLRNVVADIPAGGIYFRLDDYASDGITVVSNYIWKGNRAINLGTTGDTGGHSNAVVYGNYAVDDSSTPFYLGSGWFNMIWTNNTAVNISSRYVWTMGDEAGAAGDIDSHVIDYNTYYSITNVAPYHGHPFSAEGTSYSFPDWGVAVKGETNSTYTDGTPENLTSFVFRPSTDNSFVHVAVFNWPTNATTDVDLSAFYSVGDSLSVYDAQNIPTAYTNFTYAGGNVTLDLSLTNRAEMLGTFTNRVDEWTGFDPRFRAFVIHRTGQDRTINIGTLRAQNLILR